MPTMCEPPRARASASGPPVEPLTRRLLAASQSCSTPGSFMARDRPPEVTCIAREAGPNQPR